MRIGSYLPFQPNPLFEGRVDHLKQLAKSLLKDTHTGVVVNQAITGMGGLGKTQLAVKFAYRYGARLDDTHTDHPNVKALQDNLDSLGE